MGGLAGLERAKEHWVVIEVACVDAVAADAKDAKDADRLRHDPMLQIFADQKLEKRSTPSPPSAFAKCAFLRDLVRLNNILLEI